MTRIAINPGVYRESASERDIQSAIVEWLQWNKWLVIETSQVHAITGGLIGCPDVIAMKRMDDGLTVTLLIECKTRRGKLRRSQTEFAERIAEHVSSTLVYVVARSIDDVLDALQEAEK